MLPAQRFNLGNVPEAQHSWTLYEIAYNATSCPKGTPYTVKKLPKDDFIDGTHYAYIAHRIIEIHLFEFEGAESKFNNWLAGWREKPPTNKEEVEREQEKVSHLQGDVFRLARYIEADRHTPVTRRSKEDGLVTYR
jgi:hypothetical protein